MLKETYLANIKNLPEDCHKEFVNNYNILAPSKSLKIEAGIQKKKDGSKNPKMDFEIFKEQYIQEIQTNLKAIRRMQYLKLLSREKDVYLICYEKNYPCHRFILLKLINQLPIPCINPKFDSCGSHCSKFKLGDPNRCLFQEQILNEEKNK
ncbi:MAG: DUF488 family protein [Promethearchaeota archaeon]